MRTQLRQKPDWRLIMAAAMLYFAFNTLAAEPGGIGRERFLASGWKFQKGDFPGAAMADFDDSRWRTVSIPHDWSIEGPYDQHANAVRHDEFTKWVVWRKAGAQAYLPRGIAWYRLAFEQPALGPNQKALIYFEGVYRESEVWLNGMPLGRHPGGYTSFFYDITPALRSGRNVLAVRCDASLKEGWWFEACGIYRPVSLVVTDKLSIPPWGVWVSTPEITAESATARVQTTIRNHYATARSVMVETRVVDGLGVEIGKSETKQEIAANQAADVAQLVPIRAPRLWSPDHPCLYRARVRVINNGAAVDTTEIDFGIRAYHFDPELGYFLNGRPLKLWGMANHMDIAALGGRLPPRVCFESIAVLKKSGANFLRGAHNPRTPAELDAADRLGVCVVEETRYFDNSDFGKDSLRDMILRDRNHPSIIIWSLGNEEEGRQGTPEGVSIAKDLIGVARSNDPYRAVSIAQNHNFNQPCGFSDLFDVLGLNWRGLEETAEDHRLFPKRAMYVSEYGYGGDAWDHYAEWSWLAGAAAWGGFEYYGEGSWPSKTWPGQVADICHEPIPQYHRAGAQWSSKPALWVENTWKGESGRNVELHGYTNCQEVRVLVDGSLARKIVRDPARRASLQTWRLRVASDGGAMLIASDGRALRHTDLSLVLADPADPAQSWQMLEKATGAIAFSTGSDHVLNVVGGSTADGAAVKLYPGAGGGLNEQWKLDKNGNGALRIIGVQSGKCLAFDADGAGLVLSIPAKPCRDENAPTFVSTGESELRVSLPFKPESVVRVEGFASGTVAVCQELPAIGKPVRLILESKAASLRNDGMDVALLRCAIADSKGNTIPDADRKVRIEVAGAGTFAGSGNACRDVTDAGGIPATSPETFTFKGLCQFAVRAGLEAGQIVARVRAEGLEPAEVKIPISPDANPAEGSMEAQGEVLLPGTSPDGFALLGIKQSATTIAANENVETTLEVANISSAYPVEIRIALDGKPVLGERFSVPLGGHRCISVRSPKLYTEGAHCMNIALLRNAHEIVTRTCKITVRSTPVAFATESLSVTPYVSESGTIQVAATVRNVGSSAAEQASIPILVDGKPAVTRRVSLGAGEVASIAASITAPSGDKHEVTVAGENATVAIHKPFKQGAGIETVGESARVSGKTAMALKLSGANNFIKITPVDLKEKSFTIWMRCKLDALDATSKEGPLFSGGNPDGRTGMRAGFRDGRVFLAVPGNNDLQTKSKVPVGRWVDLAFVLEAKYVPKQTGPDGADLQRAYWTGREHIYVDGRHDSVADCRVYLGNLSYIGANNGNASTFNGLIEDVRVYNDALGAAQIEQLGNGIAPATQTAFWLKP